MDMSSALLLAGATAALVAIPGPNVALFIANTLTYGVRYGCATVVGTTVGVGFQLVIAVLGLAVLLEVASGVMIWIKWAGVAYLIYLGINAWKQGANDFDQPKVNCKSVPTFFCQGLFLAMANPKTLKFIAAFLPQFTGDAPTAKGMSIAAAIYIYVVFVGDLLWVAAARVARPSVVRLGRMRHRPTGVLFLGSGIGLAMARVEG